jgi:hypothetical protein
MSWYRAPLRDLRPDITTCRNVEVSLRLTVSQSWYRAPLWDLRPDVTSCQNVEVEVTLWLTVSQSVLVSSTLVGLASRYYFLSEYCRSRSYFMTDWQSVSQSVSLGIEHPWGTCNQILLPVGMSKLLYDCWYVLVSSTCCTYIVIQCVHKVHSGFWKMVYYIALCVSLNVGVTIHAKLDVWIL